MAATITPEASLTFKQKQHQTRGTRQLNGEGLRQLLVTTTPIQRSKKQMVHPSVDTDWKDDDLIENCSP